MNGFRKCDHCHIDIKQSEPHKVYDLLDQCGLLSHTESKSDRKEPVWNKEVKFEFVWTEYVTFLEDIEQKKWLIKKYSLVGSNYQSKLKLFIVNFSHMHTKYNSIQWYTEQTDCHEYTYPRINRLIEDLYEYLNDVIIINTSHDVSSLSSI